MGGIMKLLSKDKIIEYLIIILVTMGIVKIGWTIIEFSILDGDDVEYHKPSDLKSLYYRPNFSSEKIKENVKKEEVVFSNTIDSIKLLGIYNSDTQTIITVSKDGETKVISRKGDIDGYILYGGTETQALFRRDNETYSISIEQESQNAKNSITYVTTNRDATTQMQDTNSKDIYSGDGVTTIKRDFIKKYTQNMGNIWKNIGINEKVVNGHIIGFQVNFVKRGSDFARLGLRRGDIITAINGNALDNYAKALDIYKNINSLENLTLTIKRRNEEMELEYEIK
jgi:general secretion pathway protein C